jgi:hypothetical protein
MLIRVASPEVTRPADTLTPQDTVLGIPIGRHCRSVLQCPLQPCRPQPVLARQNHPFAGSRAAQTAWLLRKVNLGGIELVGRGAATIGDVPPLPIPPLPANLHHPRPTPTPGHHNQGDAQVEKGNCRLPICWLFYGFDNANNPGKIALRRPLSNFGAEILERMSFRPAHPQVGGGSSC